MQATDNNFVGGDVIPNYLESYFFAKESYLSTFWLSFCEWMLSFMLPAFVRVLSLARHWYCLHVYIQLLAVCGRHFLILCWKSSLLLCWKIFSTRGHKPSLFWFRFLDLGLVLPQEDGSSNDISFLTSQWRLVCDWIFDLCRPLTSLHTISFIKKRYMCVCWWVYLFVSYCDFEMERQMKQNWSNFRLIYRRSRGCTGCFTRVPQMKM